MGGLLEAVCPCTFGFAVGAPTTFAADGLISFYDQGPAGNYVHEKKVKSPLLTR